MALPGVQTSTKGPQPIAASLRGRGILADIVVVIGAALLIWVIIRLSNGMRAPFNTTSPSPPIDTNPWKLPYYAGRSVLRMFIGLVLSTVFTFIYAIVAARSPRARLVLLPLLDILQSIPILGFLTVTVSLFIGLFPHSTLGLECAAIFAIFTSQAWNMTFAFYQFLVSQPRELVEAATNLRLSRWKKFWVLDVPSGLIPLVWNGMMSFGAGWFFLTASEAVTVNNKDFTIPGIGAYVAAASNEGNVGHVVWATVTMIIVIIVVNIFFWSPLTAWVERFRIENSESEVTPKSWVLNLLRRSHAYEVLRNFISPVSKIINAAGNALFGTTGPIESRPAKNKRLYDGLYIIALIVIVGYLLSRIMIYFHSTTTWHELGTVFLAGGATLLRVVVVLVISTIIWVPIGLWIGMRPRINRFLQPVIQVAAAFPANFLFPIFIMLFTLTHIPFTIGGAILMALGSQWYILFNVIAGASAIPNDLLEAANDMQLNQSMRWRKVLLPAIFSSYVTGGLTAAGGAWNASIVSEVVSFNHNTYTSFGLGSYITKATNLGNNSHLLLGIVVMCIFVVGLNSAFWRKLYSLAERRYSLQ